MTSSELELLPVEDLNIIKNQKIKIDSQNAIDYDSILKKIVALSDEGDFNETFAEIKMKFNAYCVLLIRTRIYRQVKKL